MRCVFHLCIQLIRGLIDEFKIASFNLRPRLFPARGQECPRYTWSSAWLVDVVGAFACLQGAGHIEDYCQVTGGLSPPEQR